MTNSTTHSDRQRQGYIHTTDLVDFIIHFVLRLESIDQFLQAADVRLTSGQWLILYNQNRKHTYIFYLLIHYCTYYAHRASHSKSEALSRHEHEIRACCRTDYNANHFSNKLEDLSHLYTYGK